MKKKLLPALVLSLLCIATDAADITVRPSREIGPVKIMNAVNNGPLFKSEDQNTDNFDLYKAGCFPYARTHDSNAGAYGGDHNIDITGVFPDFDADVNEPASYDFAFTDAYVKNIQDAGTKVFYRLGQSIENGVKKYNVFPPKDYLKWAEICEHIIRHYTEGWADGFHYDIEYWEIWNEPDLDMGSEAWRTMPRTWGGSEEEFFEFFKVSSSHLKKCFPHLKIGGPASASHDDWVERFLTYCEANGVKMDFFSWHAYRKRPESILHRGERVKEMLIRHGYGDVESICNEWNYIKGWNADFQYSVNEISSVKGAAFVGATLTLCQSGPVDMLMYYDARYNTQFNGLFDFYSQETKAPYYALYGWHKLLRLGTRVESESTEKDIYVTAAKGLSGRLGIYIVRFNDDNNVTSKKTVSVDVGEIPDGAEIIGHVTDAYNKFTEIVLEVRDGKIIANMHPNSLMYVEVR